MYYHNVEFWVGRAPEWIDAQIAERKTHRPFLSHALIDVPDVGKLLPEVGKIMRSDGILTVFTPNITQIVECVTLIRQLKLPFVLDDVVQLGNPAYPSWEVRPVRTRESIKAHAEAQAKRQRDSDTSSTQKDESLEPDATPSVSDATESSDEADISSVRALKVAASAREWQQNEDREDAAGTSTENDGEWAMICRPKTSEKVGTGGFLGVWRRMKVQKVDAE